MTGAEPKPTGMTWRECAVHLLVGETFSVTLAALA
jgi:hypothetical protein